MMTELLPGMLGYLLALGSLGGAFYFWRRAQAYYQQVNILARRCDELMAEKNLHGTTLKDQKATVSTLSKKLQKVEKDLAAGDSRLAAVKAEAEQKKTELKNELTKTANQLDHYQAQTIALTAQLQESDGERRGVRLHWEEKLAAVEAKHRNERGNFDAKITELRLELKRAERNQRKAEATLQTTTEKMLSVDPEAVRKAKFRVHQYHHLYQIMRGHKEMAEERNRNWELALRILARSILSDKAPEQALPDKLGSLVAGALEAIKHGPLINDGEEDLHGPDLTALLRDCDHQASLSNGSDSMIVPVGPMQ